jgi:SPP1 family predicted phage head-tail adaptor
VAKSPIGKFNRRPTFQNTSYSQDAGGGSPLVVLESWQAWAEIIDTGGAAFVSQSQELARADYKVRVRFDSRFKSTTRMVYEGQICHCENMDVDSEGYKSFLVFRFSKTDTWVDLS